jgi:hypothetical protein
MFPGNKSRAYVSREGEETKKASRAMSSLLAVIRAMAFSA